MPRSIDTLEPLIDAVRDGIESRGWVLSGIQKTTSTEFEGRWAGESTRSAYLFFHRDAIDGAAVDVYLDETRGGVNGSFSLVLDLADRAEFQEIRPLLARLAERAEVHLPARYRTPITLRLRLRDSSHTADRVDLEARLRLVLSPETIREGGAAVSTLASATVDAFDALLTDPALPR